MNISQMAVISFSIFVFVSRAFAQDWPSETELKSILESISAFKSTSERALEASRLLLGKPYFLGPQGEGANGDVDKKPISTFQQLDCTTYVESVLALAFTPPKSASGETDYRFFLKDIKYSDPNEVSFVNRNHFPELHWIPNSEKKQYLKDVTLEIDPTAPERIEWIDLDGWFTNQAKAFADQIRVLEAGSDADKKQKISELEGKIAGLNRASPNKKVTPLGRVRYVPLTALLTKSVQDKIKTEKILVFNLVKNEHTLKDLNLIISHQGFVIERDGKLYFRHASRGTQTLDIPFENYIQERLKDTVWPTLGFNLMRIQDGIMSCPWMARTSL